MKASRLLAILGVFLAAYASAALFCARQPLNSCCRFLIDAREQALDAAYGQLWHGGPAGIPSAVEGFRAALRADPASAHRWCDLGDAFMESGQQEKARYCFSRALLQGAHSPPILMRVASFHIRAGENREAAQRMSHILSLIAEFDSIIFSYYDRLGLETSEILANGIPDDRRAAQAFFRHLLRTRGVQDAQAAWNWVCARRFPDDLWAGEYAEFLIHNQRHELAAQTWALHVADRRGDYLRSNRLFNGDFEVEPTETILDWKIRPLAGVRVSRDSAVSRSGAWSLRVDFEGKENLDYHHVSQTAVVQPGRYRFQAYLRTASLTTDQGVGLRIFDPDSPARLDLATERLAGDNDWTRLQRTVVVSPRTRWLEIQLIRLPSSKFDNKIRGSVWLDAVSLHPTL